jgi:hypothetical protein
VIETLMSASPPTQPTEHDVFEKKKRDEVRNNSRAAKVSGSIPFSGESECIAKIDNAAFSYRPLDVGAKQGWWTRRLLVCCGLVHGLASAPLADLLQAF